MARSEAPPKPGWSGDIVIPGSDASTTSFTLKGLTNGMEHRFKVRAVSASGNGKFAPLHDPWYAAATPQCERRSNDVPGRRLDSLIMAE